MMIKYLNKNKNKMKNLFIYLFISSIILSANAAELDTLALTSNAMHRSIKSIVIKPNTYALNKERYSVLYLLHGAGGNHTDWASNTPQIQAYADTYNMIIVCPDGGFTSWYFDSPIDDTLKYETYISQELVPAIDRRYRTIPNKSNRAITGLSMGGHGAFYLAFKHQDIWGAAGSMSGGLDIRQFLDDWDLPKRLGSYATHPENWEENSVINMIHLLKETKLKLLFDCGVDDFFYDANKRMHEKLAKNNIAHHYIERPGAHSWEYWSESIKYQSLFFSEFFKSNEI